MLYGYFGSITGVSVGYCAGINREVHCACRCQSNWGIGEFRAGKEAMEIPPKIPRSTHGVMIFLSIKVSFPILVAHRGGLGPSR